MITDYDIALLNGMLNEMQDKPYVVIPKLYLTNLIDAGMVECNDELADKEGHTAVRPTAKGRQAAMAAVNDDRTDWPDAVSSPVDTYTLVNGFKIPTRPKPAHTRRVPRYPFDTMNFGEAFFIAATEEHPNPKKRLASTVSSANKRFKQHAEPRQFKLVAATQGQMFGAVVAPADGVYIVRVEVTENEEDV